MEEENDIEGWTFLEHPERIPRLYEFRMHKIQRVKAIGNQLRNVECPLPRSGHRIVIYKGNIFAFGGYSPRDRETNEIIHPPNDRVLFQELWQFNLASRTWLNVKTSGDMPAEVASHAAVLLDNFMLVYGGTGIPFGQSSSNDANLCNLETLEWFSLITDGESPQPLYGQALAVHNNKMYALGGTTGFEYFLAVHCLDLLTLKWTRLDLLKRQRYQPPARYRHEIVIYDDRIYVFGGGTAIGGYDLKEIPVFNVKDNTWDIFQITSTEYPDSRLCHSCVQIGSDVYLYGGHNGTQIFSDIWKISLEQMSWTKVDTSLPIPLYFHSTAISKEGQVFIFGGVTDTHEEIRTNDVFTMWLTIPSLSDMCWQAVTSYVPHIGLLDKQTLFKAGIPMSYLNQVEFSSKPDKNDK